MLWCDADRFSRSPDLVSTLAPVGTLSLAPLAVKKSDLSTLNRTDRGLVQLPRMVLLKGSHFQTFSVSSLPKRTCEINPTLWEHCFKMCWISWVPFNPTACFSEMLFFSHSGVKWLHWYWRNLIGQLWMWQIEGSSHHLSSFGAYLAFPFFFWALHRTREINKPSAIHIHEKWHLSFVEFKLPHCSYSEWKFWKCRKRLLELHKSVNTLCVYSALK